MAEKSTVEDKDGITQKDTGSTDMLRVGDDDSLARNSSTPAFSEIVSPGDMEFQKSSDFTDYVAKDRKRKAFTTTAAIVSTALLVAGVAYGGYSIVKSSHNDTPSTVASQQTDGPTTGSSGDTKKTATAPLKKITEGKVEKAVESEVKASVDKSTGTVSLSNNSIVLFSGYTVLPSRDVCSVVKTTDFCFTGTVLSKNVDTEAYLKEDSPSVAQKDVAASVYLVRDIVTSRLMEKAENIKEVQVPGAVASATLTLHMGNSSTEALVVVLPDSSGLLVTFDSPDSAKDLSSSITVG